jgi:hypothetical protein
MKIWPFGNATRFDAHPCGLVTATGVDRQDTVIASIEHQALATAIVSELNHMIGQKRRWSRIWNHLRLLEPGEQAANPDMRIDIVSDVSPERKPFATLVGKPSRNTMIEAMLACSLFHLLLNAGSPTCGRVAMGAISIENQANSLATGRQAMKNDVDGKNIRRHVRNKRGLA